MRVELRLGGLITVNGRPIPLGRTHVLLDGIGERRSVAGAAERLGVSYRSAWEQLRDLEAAFGRPLVVKTKGHGTELTELGLGLRDALAATVTAFAPPVAREAAALEARLAGLLDAPPAPLRLALSHDPLLLEALGRLTDVAARVTGSEEAIGLLLRGEADAAGFHRGPDEPPPAGGEIVTRPLFRRQQGLLVAPGNPLGIADVAGIARVGARFVNRQRGSGTRAWFDRLLAEAALSPADIRGYGTEEFTHQAVAALVAAGAADIAMGLRAVADRFGLGFVGLGWETYALAARADRADDLAGRLVAETAPLLAATPGYAPAAG